MSFIKSESARRALEQSRTPPLSPDVALKNWEFQIAGNLQAELIEAIALRMTEEKKGLVDARDVEALFKDFEVTLDFDKDHDQLRLEIKDPDQLLISNLTAPGNKDTFKLDANASFGGLSDEHAGTYWVYHARTPADLFEGVNAILPRHPMDLAQLSSTRGVA